MNIVFLSLIWKIINVSTSRLMNFYMGILIAPSRFSSLHQFPPTFAKLWITLLMQRYLKFLYNYQLYFSTRWHEIYQWTIIAIKHIDEIIVHKFLQSVEISIFGCKPCWRSGEAYTWAQNLSTVDRVSSCKDCICSMSPIFFWRSSSLSFCVSNCCTNFLFWKISTRMSISSEFPTLPKDTAGMIAVFLLLGGSSLGPDPLEAPLSTLLLSETAEEGLFEAMETWRTKQIRQKQSKQKFNLIVFEWIQC